MKGDPLTVEMFRQLAKSQKLDGYKQPPEVWQSVVNRFLALPALRGFWPMSSVDYTAANRASDLSGQGYHLTDNNTPIFGYDNLAPYCDLDGVNQALTRADGGAGNWADILGTEAYIAAAYRGLTFGGWFNFDAAAGATEVIIAKANSTNAAATISYIMFRQVAGSIRLRTSDGVAINTVTSTATPAQGDWFFLAGRFDPSTSQDIFVNDEKSSLLAGLNANIQDTAIDFCIGALSNLSGNFCNMKASMCFLCAAQLSDAIILSLFEQTRALYGV